MLQGITLNSNKGEIFQLGVCEAIIPKKKKLVFGDAEFGCKIYKLLQIILLAKIDCDILNVIG
jgi:hypothetical protein